MHDIAPARWLVVPIVIFLFSFSLLFCFIGPECSRLNLDWPSRLRICIGIAKGLAYLHEESSLKIVHRDIKATNVLLDGKLNPKISDFGLAKHDDEEKTHITTRVAGTMYVPIISFNETPTYYMLQNKTVVYDNLVYVKSLCFSGYMAPEYALWGYLTHKADVYSFGVVALEVISGRSNNDYVPSDTCVCLLDWVIRCSSCPFLF